MREGAAEVPHTDLAPEARLELDRRCYACPRESGSLRPLTAWCRPRSAEDVRPPDGRRAFVVGMAFSCHRHLSHSVAQHGECMHGHVRDMAV